jgi:phenylalanyl-tRNA synthetase beta chain
VNVSRRWLEAFLNRPIATRDLAERLAMLGAPVDAVEPQYAHLEPVVVGLVEELRPHPNADRLQICQVAIGGGERRQVVTGATNVVAGRTYPFAGVGVTLPIGLTLERRKLRGEVSEGMLCSAKELGLGDDQAGILELGTPAAPGTPLPVALDLADDRIVLDVPPVRGDLLGHKGVARELAGSFGLAFRLPAIPGAPADSLPAFRRAEGGSPASTGGLTVSIAAGSAGRRFTAAVIEGVTVGPSPEWLRRRLEAIGQRPINNVVDVTNYVMNEVGQPLHGYDATKLRGAQLSARLAAAGEWLVTLDGTRRALDPSMTVIADAEGPVGIAGVMGGLESEVTAATTTVALEAAWWDPAATRTTRRRLGIATEASQRFERGTDLWGLPDALRRAIEVLLATAGGRVAGVPVDVWPEPTHPPRIFLRVARVAQIVGLDLPIETIERALVAIGATVLAKPDDARLAVDVPGWRPDLRSEIDLVEEVARLYGYDRLPDTLRPFRPGIQSDPPSEALALRIREALAAEGLHEVVTLPIGPATGPSAVPVLNPISAEHGFLRGRILPGLVRQVESNWANHVRDVRLFELGTTFAPGSPGGPPLETQRLAAVLTGARAPAHWTDGASAPDLDWWDLKGVLERAVSLANPEARMQVDGAGLVARVGDGREVGRAGPQEADRPPWAAPLWGLEVEIAGGEPSRPTYVPLPSVPAASRDLALVVPWTVGASAVGERIAATGGGLLESVRVIDQYTGEGIPEAARSLLFRLVFRAADRTLRDREVDGVVDRIRAVLEKELGVTLRTT